MPDLEQDQEAGEADDGADDVGQIRPEIDRGRQLAGDVAERADHGERPAALHALLAADQVEQDPRRQQREDGDDLADRAGQRQKRHAGHRGQGDDRRAERAVRHRRVVGDRRDPDRIERRNAERDQDRRDEGPRIAEADQPFEQRAERPGEQDGLHPHVAGSLLDQPAPQLVEGAGRDQRVEQHHSPKRDPVDVPNAGGGAVKIGAQPIVERHLPDPEPEQERDDRADQHREPRRHAKPREQKQQQHDRNQRDQPGHEQISSRIENLREHGQSLPARTCERLLFFPILWPHERRVRMRLPTRGKQDWPSSRHTTSSGLDGARLSPDRRRISRARWVCDIATHQHGFGHCSL